MPLNTKRSELARWIEARRPDRIGEAECAEIRAALDPISENYLRKLLRERKVPLDPMVEGVRQGSYDELHESLLHLLELYENSEAARRRAVRAIVITAKDHAKLAAKSKHASPEKRSEKEEMILWMLTWLENPGVFPDWVKLRRARWEIEANPPADS